MKIKFTIYIIVFFTFYLNAQPTYKDINDRIEKIERENIELKAKVEAYNDNNSNILNTVSITLGVLFGIFGLINITQLVQNYRLNNKKIIDTKNELKEYFNGEINSKLDLKVASKLSEITLLKNKISYLEIEILSIRCASTDPQNPDSEINRLIRLLHLSFEYYRKNTSSEYLVDIALRGIIKHLERHTVLDYEKEELHKGLNNEELKSKFEFKINKINELLKSKD